MRFLVGAKVNLRAAGRRALESDGHVYGVDFNDLTQLTVIEGPRPCDCGNPRHKEDCNSLYQKMEFPDGGVIFFSEKEIEI